MSGMTELADPRAAISTAAEDRFVELFAEAFGVEKVQLLSPEHPVQDIYGATRFVDFAIRTPAQRVAFEIDGLVWHHPEAFHGRSGGNTRAWMSRRRC